MTFSASLSLHILSSLASLGRPQSDRSKLGEQLSYWLPALKTASSEHVTIRQLRRWRLLAAYWQRESPRLLEQMQQRGYFQAASQASLEALSAALQVPEEALLFEAARTCCHALFITSLPWGERYGDTRPLELRELKFEKQIPPFHLSARVKEASILSAGSLAIESLGKWLGKTLETEQAVPLWVEAAFPDDIRVTDESASLAFVAAALQKMLGLDLPVQAFSGIVKRDSGQVQQVQGFDLPYGKLEAAFDQGVQELYLPPQTAIQVHPQAGICLEKITAAQFRYYLADQPEDSMDIFYVEDLQSLFEQAFLRHYQPSFVSPAQMLRSHISTRFIQPDFVQWRELCKQLEHILPQPLPQTFESFCQLYQQAFAYQGTSWDEPQVWQPALRGFQEFLRGLMIYLAGLCLTPEFVMADLSARAQSLNWLKLRFEASAPALWRQAWQELSLSLSAENRHPLSSLERWFRQNSQQIEVILAESEAQSGPLHLHPAQYLWNQVSHLSQLCLPESVLKDFKVCFVSNQHDSLSVQSLNPSYEQNLAFNQLSGLSESAYFVCDTQQQQLWTLPFLNLSFMNQDLQVPLARHMQACVTLERCFPDAVFTEEGQVFLPFERAFCMQLRLRAPAGIKLWIQDSSLLGLSNPELQPVITEALTEDGLVLEYLCQAEDLGGLDFQPPAIQQYFADMLLPVYFSYQSPQVTIVSTQTAQLRVKRSFEEVRNGFQTHKPFEMLLEIQNQSPLAVSNLSWPQGLLLPQGCRLLDSDTICLPDVLEAFQTLRLSLRLDMALSGQASFASLPLAYQFKNESVSVWFEELNLYFAFYGSGQLFGRSAERQALWQWLQQGRSQAYYLYGETGIGKQFLVEACAADTAYELITLRPNATFSFAYGAIKEILTQLLSQSDRQKLDLAESHLRALENFCQGKAFSFELNARDNKEHLYTAIREFLGLFTQQRPLLIAWHQLDAVDPESLELLQYLLQHPPAQRKLLFVLCAESKSLPLALRTFEIPLLQLKGLNLEELQSWFDFLFQPHELSQAFFEQLLKETRGNPLFIHELFVYFQETKQLYFEVHSQSWKFIQQDVFQHFPDSLDYLFSKKIQVLQQERPILDLLAVQGGEASLADLKAILEIAEDDLEDALDKLLSVRILTEKSLDLFNLEPPLLGKYLYTLLGRKARRLHLKTAEYLESRTQMDISSLEKLAHHFKLAHKNQKAFYYCLKCAQAYQAQGLLASALPWLKQALDLQQAEPEAYLEQASELFYCLGTVRQYSEDLIQARQDYLKCLEFPDSGYAFRAKLALAQLSPPQEALSLYLDVLDQVVAEPQLKSEALLHLGRYYAAQAEPALAQKAFEEALEQIADSSLLKAEILEAWAYEVIKQGQHQQAELYLLQSREIYLKLKSEAGLAQVNNRLGACCFYQQELIKAEHYFNDCLRFYIKTHNKVKQTHIQHNLGLLYESQQKDALAQAYYLQNLEISLEIKNIDFAGFSALQLSSLALKSRQLAQARQYLDLAAGYLQNTSEKRGQAYLCLHQGMLSLLEGVLEQAETYLSKAFELFEALKDIMGQDRVRMRLGHCYWLQGHAQAAREHYLTSLALRQELDKAGQDGLERVYHALGILECEQGALKQAEAYFKQSHQLLSKREDLQNRAIIAKNLAYLYQQLEHQDLQSMFEQEYQMLNGLGTFALQQELAQTQGLFPILDD